MFWHKGQRSASRGGGVWKWFQSGFWHGRSGPRRSGPCQPVWNSQLLASACPSRSCLWPLGMKPTEDRVIFSACFLPSPSGRAGLFITSSSSVFLMAGGNASHFAGLWSVLSHPARVLLPSCSCCQYVTWSSHRSAALHFPEQQHDKQKPEISLQFYFPVNIADLLKIESTSF